MASENLERLKSAYVAFAGGDIPVLLAAMSPDVDWDATGALIHTGRYEGHAGVVEYLQGFAATWAEFALVPEDFVAVQDDLVIVHGYIQGVEKEGGRTVTASFSHHVRFEGELIARIQIMLDASTLERSA